MTYYQELKMVGIVIRVPPSIDKAINVRTVATKKSKRMLCEEAVQHFIASHGQYDRRRKSASIAIDPRTQQKYAYQIPYKNPNAIKLRFWIEREIGEKAAELAREANITRSAFIYSALCKKYRLEEIKDRAVIDPKKHTIDTLNAG